MYSGKSWFAVVTMCLILSGSAYARYYDPALGRFINRDPVDNVDNQRGVGAVVYHVQFAGRFVSRAPTHFSGPNSYQYVSSRPTMFLDPLGLRDLAPVPIKDKNGKLCGTIKIGSENDPTEVGFVKNTFKFEPADDASKCECCEGNKFGWVQHKFTGGAWSYDNKPSSPSNPNKPPVTDPNVAGYTGNTWYGGPSASGKPEPSDGGLPYNEKNDNWQQNPRPQNSIVDAPSDKSSVYVSQLVCQKDGKIWGSWRYKNTQREPLSVSGGEIKP